MKNILLAAITASVVLGAASASAQTVTWTSIVGITDPGNIVGSTANPPVCATNGQGCINGAGQPWTVAGPLGPEIEENLPKVTLNLATGALHFSVNGLVTAGGNFVGSPPAVASIVGTIFCLARPPGANFIVTTAPTGLNREGGALFTGSVGALPPTCNRNNVSFLIQTSPTGPWIAFGAQRLVKP